ncbi:MAG: BatA domain-containing protein [Clostridiaceae bacterium]
MILQFPWGLLALLAVPVIIILYLLKQKHEEFITSSLYLWQNALQDIEANTPWQRLKKNILMFLQIFAVILLALILSEPVIQNIGSRGGAVMLVMDCSLSMQSTDMKPSRFEAARADAVKLVEACRDGTEFTVIASGSTPYIVIHKTTNSNNVIREINNLKATDTAEDPDGTAELVQSLVRDNAEIQIYWFGDGTDPVSGNNAVYYGDNARYYSYNRNGDNYAVTLLSQRKNQNSREITALSRIANFSKQDAELDVSLYADGNFFDARRVKVGAGKSESIYWAGIPDSVYRLECRIDTEDILLKDNIAGVMVQTEKNGKVLLATEKNVFLEKILSLMPNLDVYRTGMDDADELKGYDLYIFDGKLPAKLPEDGHAILFKPSGNEYFSLSGMSEYTVIRSASHRLYNNLKQDISFDAMKTDLFRLPEWGSPLMENDEGITAFEGFLGRRRIMVFGFDLHETNLPVQPFFPVIMTRAIQELLPGGYNEITAVNAGDSFDLSVDPEAKEVYAVGPDGNRTRIAPPFPVTSFSGTTQIGVYELEQQLENETVKQQFFVNAPSEKEHALSAAASELSDDQDVGEGWEERRVSGGWSLKMLLLWVLLAILAIEWWVYSNGTTI